MSDGRVAALFSQPHSDATRNISETARAI